MVTFFFLGGQCIFSQEKVSFSKSFQFSSCHRDDTAYEKLYLIRPDMNHCEPFICLPTYLPVHFGIIHAIKHLSMEQKYMQNMFNALLVSGCFVPQLDFMLSSPYYKTSHCLAVFDSAHFSIPIMNSSLSNLRQ